jgi:flagellar hook assembly protein FlgD
VLLDIYNLKGQKVKTLITGNQPEGKHTAVWDGRDDRGSGVGSGVYLYRLKVNESSFQQRMLLLK